MYRRVFRRAINWLPIGIVASVPRKLHLQELQLKKHRTVVGPFREVGKLDDIDGSELKNKCLVLYQKSGDDYIDSQVADLVTNFIETQASAISSKFQFIFLAGDSDNPEPLEDKLTLVILHRDVKMVRLSKVIATDSSKPKVLYNTRHVFDRLVEHINGFHEAKAVNINQIVERIQNSPEDAHLVVVPDGDDQAAVSKAKKVLKNYVDNNQLYSNNVMRFVVGDECAARVLGCRSHNLESNKVYALTQLTSNICADSVEGPIHSINGLSYKFFNLNEKPLSKIQVFPSASPKAHFGSQFIKISLDQNNSVGWAIKQRLHEIFQDPRLIDMRKVIVSQTHPNGSPLEITFHKTVFDEAVYCYEKGCRYTHQEIKDILGHSHENHLEDAVNNLSVDRILGWLKSSPPEYYRSEAPQLQYNSSAIVGEEYANTVRNAVNFDRIIFHYSKTCHSCKKFGGLYQQIAAELGPWGKGLSQQGNSQQKRNIFPIEFFRINNDLNKTSQMRNYNSTPIFVMYKRGYPQYPFYFKMPYFTKELFKNFITITQDLKLISEPSIWDQGLTMAKQFEAFKQAQII